MKYRLLQDLPFLKANSVLCYGCWVGGGLGVDRGETKYANGSRSHNGIRIFKKHENELLESIFDNKQWMKALPETMGEAMDLYDTEYLNRKEFLAILQEFKLR